MFQKGQSGNPRGKPKGTRHKTTLLAEKIFSGDIEEICRSVVTAAKNGDMRAAKIVIERILPPVKSRSVSVTLPDISSASDAASAFAALLKSVASDEVDLDHARLWVRRLKNGLAVEHPMAGDELRAIKRYLGLRTDALPWLFISEREQPLTRQSVNYLIATAAERAELSPFHPHMLRHSCGFYLANRGYDLRLIQDYLGHRDPKHTVHYARVAGSRFEGLWR